MTGPLSSIQLRKVRCPKCNALLTEPSPETPIYQCANCSTFLQVKHPVSTNRTNGNNDRTRGNPAPMEELQEDERSIDELQAAAKKSERGLEQERIQFRLVNTVSSEESNRLSVPEMSDEYSDDGSSSLADDQPLYRRRRSSSRSGTGRVKSFVSKTDAATDEKPLYTPRLRRSWTPRSSKSSNRTDQITQRDGPEPAPCSSSQLSVQAFPHLSQERTSATVPNRRWSEDVPVASGNGSQNFDQKDILPSTWREEGRSFRNESLFRSNSMDRLPQQPFIYRSSAYGAETDDEENARDGGGSAEHKEENVGYGAEEDMKGSGYPHSHSITKPSANIRHVVKKQSNLEVEKNVGLGVSADDMSYDMEESRQTHLLFDATESPPSSSQVTKQGATPEEAAFPPTSTFDSYGESEASSGEATNEYYSFNGYHTLEEAHTDLSFTQKSQAEILLVEPEEILGSTGTANVPHYYEDEARSSTGDEVSTVSNRTTVHNGWQDGEQDAPALKMVQHEAYSCMNFNTYFGREHLTSQNNLTDDRLLSGNLSELGNNFEFRLPQVDTTPQLDVYDSPSPVVDYPTSEHSASNEANQLEMGGRFLLPVEPDAEDEQAINFPPHQNGSKEAECLGRKLPQSLDSKLATEPGNHHMTKNIYDMNSGPSHLAQSQGNDSIMGRRRIPETGTDYCGYEQRRYHLQDGKHGPYVNQRKQIDGNASYTQNASRNGGGNKPEGLMSARNVKVTKHLYDSQSPAAAQQERYVGHNLELEEKGMVSMSHGMPEQNFPVQSNRLQSRLPHIPQPVEGLTAHAYSFWNASQAGTMPSSSHDHPFLCYPQQSTHPVCIYCMQHSHMQHHRLVHGTVQHPCAMCMPQHMYAATAQLPPAHQYWAPPHMARHLPHAPHYHPGFILPEPGSCAQQVQRHESAYFNSVEQVQQQQGSAYLNSLEQLSRKQRRYPLLPMKSSVPYVLCQHCDRLLEVPSHLPTANEYIQKLRCGACRKVSKFAILHSNNANTRNDPIKRMVLGDQVISSKVHAAVAGSDAATALLKYDSPFILDGQGRDFNGSFAAWEKPDALYEKYFDTMNEDGHYHRPARHGYGNYRLLESNAISSNPPPVTVNPRLIQYFRPPTASIQKQGTGRSESGESKAYPIPDAAFQRSSLRSRYSNNTTSMAHAVDIDVTGSQQSEEYMKHRTLGGRVGSGSSSEWTVQVQGAEEPHSGGYPGIQGQSARDPQSGKSLGNEFQNHVLHVKENGSHFKPVVVSGSPLHAHFGYTSPSELLESPQNKVPAPIPTKAVYQQPKDSMFSRSNSVSYGDPPLTRTAGPRLLERFSFESLDFDGSFQQKDSPDGTSSSGRSFPWSPAGSPVYNHSTHDFADYDRETSQEATKGLRQSDQDINKGQRSLTGFLKKSLKELAKGSQKGSISRRKVTINGYVISDEVIKRVEEQAGTIHAGSYWYDFRAGFWGVMGGPCLGIIPPFIEDFNYPMPRDCAGGKTGVRVNGRELHQKDLELLARRGLPTIPGKAYSIDIDGRVVDEASGIQLKNLGKLAPTIEKKGHGFGMFQPSTAPFESNQK